MSSLASTLSSLLEGPRRYIAIGVGALIVIALAFLLFSGGPDIPGDPKIVAVIKAGNKKDVPKLEEFAKSDDVDVASQALLQLARVQKADARPTLEAALSSPKDELRATAAMQLGSVLPPAEAGVLIKALKDPEARVRAAGCRAFASNGSPLGLEEIVTLYEKDENPQVKATALAAFSQIVGVQFAENRAATPTQRAAQIRNMRKIAAVSKKMPSPPGGGQPR